LPVGLPLVSEPGVPGALFDFLCVPASPPPPVPVSEPIDPALVPPEPYVEPAEPVPAAPVEPLPLVLWPLVLWPVLPVVPPLVEPVWANATPAPSIEISANRFHHVFRICKHSR